MPNVPIMPPAPIGGGTPAETRRFWHPALAILMLAAGLWGGSAGSAGANCRDTPEGRICTQQHQLVAGTLVEAATQRALGLVTVRVAGRGCSGTLLNQFWVLTADHCVASNPSANRVSATWTSEQRNASAVVRYGQSHGLDVALLYLGMGDLGPANIQLFYVQEVEAGMTLVKYGRGISGFANSGPPAVPAQSDGRYRSAVFTASTDGPLYTLPANSAGQIGSGGDSGGPDIVVGPGGIGLGIAGVTSGCWATGYVAGMPEEWDWATGISACRSAAIHPIRHDIVQQIQRTPYLERVGPEVLEQQPNVVVQQPGPGQQTDIVVQPPGIVVPRVPEHDIVIQIPSPIPRQ